MALLAEFFGGQPKVPEFKPVDVQQQQTKAIEGNVQSLPALQGLAGQINTFNQAELDKMLNNIFAGGYEGIKSTISGNIQSELKGEIPQDVSDAVARNAAVKSLYGGYGGTGMQRNLVARDLGLTSLQLTQRGLDSATRWMQTAKAPMFDVSSMFVRPEFQAEFAANERDKEFQRDYIENQWDWYGSFGQQLNRFENTAIQVAMSLAGSMSGGGGGCWVAREIFGEQNPKWKQFRFWLSTKAPIWFKDLYLEYGERFAKWISNKPWLKSIIRRWMESKIKPICYG